MVDKRIILFGPPLSGKTTIVETVGRREERRLESFQVPSNHPSFNLPPHSGISAILGQGTSAVELVTIPGGVFGEAPWLSLLDGACGIVVVLDSQAEFRTFELVVQNANRLFRAQGLGCVVLSKADLVAPEVVEQLRTDLVKLLEKVSISWPVFVTRFDRPDTLLRPVSFLVERVRSVKR